VTPPPARPVRISGDVGDWLLHHSGRVYRAEFHPIAGPDGPLAFWSASARSSWELEALMGGPLPPALHGYLTGHVTTIDHAWTRAASPPPRKTLPARHHSVAFDGGHGAYGEMLARAPLMASWAQDAYRVDLLHAGTLADGRSVIAHRFWHHGRVMHAQPSQLIAPGSAVDASELLQSAVTWIRRFAGDTPPGEQAWLVRHGPALTVLTALPEHPYPAGTRVVVDVGSYRGPAGGVVVDTTVAAHGPPLYAWRPDAYGLPGHRYQRRPDQVVLSFREHVRAALVVPAEAGARASYGARMSIIDHPMISGGTVVRVRPGGDGGRQYELKLDNPAFPLRWYLASELRLTTPAAWPTVREIVAAREAAGHPLVEGELLIGLREESRVVKDATGHLVPDIPSMNPSTDPLLDPDADQPFARLHRATARPDPPPATLPGL